MWGLANLASESSQIRFELFSLGFPLRVFNTLPDPLLPSHQSVVAWFLSNMVIGSFNFEDLSCFTRIIGVILQREVEEIPIEALLVLESFVKGPEDQVAFCLQEVRVQKLIYLGRSPREEEFKGTALSIIGCIISKGVIKWFWDFLNNSGLELIREFIETPLPHFKTKALWVLSNLLTGPKEAVSKILSDPTCIVEKAVIALVEDCEDVKKEAVYVLYYALLKEEPAMAALFKRMKLPFVLFEVIEAFFNAEIVEISLKILGRILNETGEDIEEEQLLKAKGKEFLMSFSMKTRNERLSNVCLGILMGMDLASTQE